MVNCDINKYNCDKSINKQLDFSCNSKLTKHNFGLIDSPYSKTDMSVVNMVSKNNSKYRDELPIIKQL